MGDLVIRKGKGTVRIKGLDGLYARLMRVAPDAQAAGVQVINDSATRAFNRSQAEVPVGPEDGGELKASGRLYKARVSPRSGRVYATITYGGTRLKKLAPGDNPIYAIVQHEDLTLKHSRGNAKFLERPTNAEKTVIIQKLVAAIGTAITRYGHNKQHYFG